MNPNDFAEKYTPFDGIADIVFGVAVILIALSVVGGMAFVFDMPTIGNCDNETNVCSSEDQTVSTLAVTGFDHPGDGIQDAIAAISVLLIIVGASVGLVLLAIGIIIVAVSLREMADMIEEHYENQ